jgi:hypothetical protein
MGTPDARAIEITTALRENTSLMEQEPPREHTEKEDIITTVPLVNALSLFLCGDV